MGSRKTNHPRLTASDLHSPEFNHLYMYGEVTKESVNRLNASIENFERPVTITLAKELKVISTAKPIMLHINSGGGDSSAVISAVRNIRNAKVPVYTIVDGIAMSAAADILLAGHVRYAYPDALVLMHQHWELVRAVKRHEDNIVDSKVSTAYYEQYKRYYLANSKLDAPGLDKLLARDRYLTAPECKKLGLVDDIIIPPTSATLKAFAKDNYESMTPGELLAAAIPRPNVDITRRLNAVPVFSQAASETGTDDEDDDDNEAEQRNLKDPETMCLFAIQAIALINRTMTTTIMSSSRGGVNSFTGIPRPIKLTIPELPFGERPQVSTIIPMISAITFSIVPVISIVESNCDFSCLLLALVCHERWIYHYSVLHIDLRYFGERSQKHIDSVTNTKVIKEFILRLFKSRAKLPPEVIKDLFQQSFIFDAKQALQYGLVDGIIDDKSRSIHPSQAVVTTSKV